VALMNLSGLGFSPAGLKQCGAENSIGKRVEFPDLLDLL